MNVSTKYAVFPIIFVAVLGGIFWYARPPEGGIGGTSVAKQNVLAVDRILHDFGTVSMQNGKVTTKFTVRNTQPNAVTLEKLYTSCMCTEASLKIGDAFEGPFGMPGHGAVPAFRYTLEPDQEAAIEVVFDPAAHGPAGVGAIKRIVTLEGGDEVLASVMITAEVTP